MGSEATGLEHTAAAGPGAESAPGPAAIELRGVTKRFGPVTACDRVDLALRAGEIHGVLGENGAGKSTLMKVLIGLVLPDEGTVLVDGVPQRIHDPQAAAALGIGMVHQHFSLVDELRVWENVALGDVGALDRAAARRQVVEIGERYGLDVDPDVRVRDLSAGFRQRVEIIKCLRRDPRVLVLDEPTSVLTPSESEQLFGVLRRVVREERRAVALVSHKLDEVLHSTDVVTIMRRGRVVAQLDTHTADAPGLARHMVGRDVSLRSESAAVGSIEAALHEAEAVEPTSESASAERITGVVGEVAGGPAPPVLVIRQACATADDGRVLLDGLDLEVHAGEIVGVAGVEGNGQRPLGDLLSSLLPLDSGRVEVAGRNVSTRRAGAMLQAGVALIPEDRHDSGCVLGMSVAENLLLTDPRRASRGGLLSRKAMNGHAAQVVDEYGIVCAGPDAPMWSLSGGNQQKLVLARELEAAPSVLVACQPTHGLDVGAIEYMNERLKQVAARGVGVLLISTELEEILSLADRVVVLYRGRAVGEMSRQAIDFDRLGLLMGGAA